MLSKTGLFGKPDGVRVGEGGTVLVCVRVDIWLCVAVSDGVNEGDWLPDAVLDGVCDGVTVWDGDTDGIAVADAV